MAAQRRSACAEIPDDPVLGSANLDVDSPLSRPLGLGQFDLEHASLVARPAILDDYGAGQRNTR